MQALEETPPEEQELKASIFRALGVTYTRAFLFEDAAGCFREEIALKRTDRAVRDCLLSCRMYMDRKEFSEEVLKMDPDSTVVQETEELIRKAEEEAAEKLSELQRLRSFNRQEFIRQSDQMIGYFKNEYRRK